MLNLMKHWPNQVEWLPEEQPKDKRDLKDKATQFVDFFSRVPYPFLNRYFVIVSYGVFSKEIKFYYIFLTI